MASKNGFSKEFFCNNFGRDGNRDEENIHNRHKEKMIWRKVCRPPEDVALSGPVRDTPPYRAIPFRDSIAEGGYRTHLLCFHMQATRQYR